MPVTELRVQGYRSIRDLTLPLKRLNVIVGANGCGKSNLYQAVSLLRSSASGSLAKAVAAEGGMASAMWAGRRSSDEQNIKLGVTIDDFEYDIELGIPPLGAVAPGTAFGLDPFVKSETLIQRIGLQRIKWLERGTSSCVIRDDKGQRVPYTLRLHHAESVLDQIVDPRTFPILDDLRRKILKWRFYHGFRTDADSPMRRAQIGVRTFVLGSDGLDVAAALQTIIENGDDKGLQEAVDDAFPGSRVQVLHDSPGTFEIALESPGVARPLVAKELSDGTLRYLCLLAALLSPSPAPLLALNEPETSLHESLLPPLGRLIAKTSASSQIWLTTHSHILTEVLCEEAGVAPIALEKVDGATLRVGRPRGAAYSAEWDG